MIAPSITEVHRQLEAMIGRRGPAVHGRIERRDIERFAHASGETSAIYFDEDAARAAGFDGIPSPPMMLPGTIEWAAGPPLGELRADGTGVGRESWLPLDGLRLMGGGQDLIFHAPVLAGTEFTARPELESVELKQGGGGQFVLIGIETDFRATDGTDLVTCRETTIAR